MSYRLVTPAELGPVSLAEAKAQCRVDGNASDSLVGSLLLAATDFAQDYTGRTLAPETWELVLDDFSDAIMFGKSPVTSIISVKYSDVEGSEQTIDSANYVLDAAGDPQWLIKASNYSWPIVADGVNNVTIRFEVGYADCPASIKQAILLWIESVYDGNPVPAAFEHLLTNKRSYGA